MAGVWCSSLTLNYLTDPILTVGFSQRRIHKVHCCSKAKDNINPKRDEAPTILKVVVTGATEFLRLLSSFNSTTTTTTTTTNRLEYVADEERDELSGLRIDEVVKILEADYGNAYFVTGIFTSDIYDQDCVFEDPTIIFQGTALYARNLKLLVPFFESPSIALEKIEKGSNSEANFVQATWKLRTYLKLPWRPLISIDGRTVYDLDDKFKIIRHAESWNVSALEAVGQIFRPSRRSDD